MSRTKSLLAGALLAAATASAQTADDLTGYWREVSRNGSKDFTDTTVLTFKPGQEFARQRANSFMYRGTYKLLPGGRMDMSGMQYKINMQGPLLVMSGDDGVRAFEKFTPPVPDASNSADRSTGRTMDDLSPTAPPALSELAGKWQIFKRTSSEVQSSVDYNRLVKSITFFEAPKNGHLGMLTVANDPPDAPSWYINTYADGVLEATGKDNRSLKIIRFADGELIIQDAPYTYFLKQFK